MFSHLFESNYLNSNKSLIIAEVGINHEGSFPMYKIDRAGK